MNTSYESGLSFILVICRISCLSPSNNQLILIFGISDFCDKYSPTPLKHYYPSFVNFVEIPCPKIVQVNID